MKRSIITGDAFAAAVAGGTAYWGPTVVFVLIAAMATTGLASVSTPPASAIDYDRAQGLHDGSSSEKEQASGFP